MTQPSPLYVPVQVDALVVNDQVRMGENFARWQANYALTRFRLSPEPPPFGNIDTDFATDPRRNGVYLQWQLPQALTEGGQDHPDQDVSFPLVPNRWLVVRTHGAPGAEERDMTAWLVESDHLDPVTGTSPYAGPDGTPTRIGRRIDLAAGEWTEPGPPGGLFLTAIGSGVPTFAVYQPYNENVFSLHDTMEGLDPAREWTVGYLVAGWYGDPGADPVAAAGDALGELLAEYDWTLGTAPGDAGGRGTPVAPASCGIFHGTVLGLSWHAHGPLPESPRPDAVAVALGHNSAHASSVFQQEAEPPDAPGLAGLLNLCQRGLLDAADEPDGAFTAARATFASWFVPTPAGHRWTLEADPDAPEEERAGARRRARRGHAALLAELNAAQAAHDEAARDLAAARRRVYDLWWAEGLPLVPEFDPDGQLPPGAYRGELTTRLRAAEEEAARCEEALAQARRRIPWGRTQGELDTSVADYLGDRAPGFVLKREVLPDLYRAMDPVVALRCTEEDQQARLAAEEGLRCRRAGELVRGVYLDAERTVLVSAPSNAVPVPRNLPALPASPDGLLPLLTEFHHLDPADAPALARAAGRPETDVAALRSAMADPGTRADGVPPALGTGPWRQAWSPLFFQWEVDYYPIAYADGDAVTDPAAANWEFDGDHYRWNGQGAGRTPLTLRGRQFLTPTPAQTFADALRHAAADRSGPYADLLNTLADQAAGADLIAQTLDGFGDQLQARGPNAAVGLGDGSAVRNAAVDDRITRELPPDPGPLPRPFAGWAPPASRRSARASSRSPA
ncbi:hypothetical protein ACQEVS_00595 [Streptomyces sp. CA-181903]|uniref:hypothetical protein n=1 Tax=Streptomyces sp. CA-181903 TaxID=3240055 RepID=UPI003D8E374C